MKKTLVVIAALASLAGSLSAQTFKEWQDPNVNQVNRAPMHTHYFAYQNAADAKAAVPETAVNYLSIDGMWKFHWVKDADARPVDFWKTDFNDASWDEIPVPGIWELHGYGDPVYVNTGWAWENQFRSNPPDIPVENNHVGSYRHEVTVPAGWNGQDIFLHIGSATSNVYVWVNGRFVGYSEDSKLEAEFDVTKYLKPGQQNLIALQIFRWCDGTYLEDQDFWRLSGIARDSYLYARAKSRIQDIRVTPDLDAQYRDGRLDVELTLNAALPVELELFDAAGQKVAGTSVKGRKGQVNASIELAAPNKWSAETPYLYTLRASAGGEVIPVRVGFRKVELKGRQVLVNGQAVLFKGADRHELDPDGGYVVSRERMIQDIQIMKQFNLNAVRTCHYPDDNFWYDLCDEYGIYMVAEANAESHGLGYGARTLAKNEQYKLAHLERNQRNVQRNFNHAAIIFWSLGNEGGDGPNFENAYRWVKAEDPSRPCQYEQAMRTDHSDIFCPMYMSHEDMEAFALDPNQTKPFIQCEYAHAMGNSVGSFKEYWDLFRKYPQLQGGFIWDFVDQSLRWKNADGVSIYAYGGDFNRYDASDQNFCDNGLISPDRVPNPHMYEVGQIYQSIWSTYEPGRLSVYNEYFFRDLSAYRLQWEVLHDGVPVRTGVVENLSVAPHATQTLPLSVGEISGTGEWLLNVKYVQKEQEGVLPAGHVVAKQQFTLRPYDFGAIALKPVVKGNYTPAAPVIRDNDRGYVIVEGETFTIEISRSTGYISRYCVGGVELLKDGSAITPNFWRAPTDNDYGASLQTKYAAWKDPKITLKARSLEARAEGGLVIVSGEYELADFATLTLSYEINNDGAVKVREAMKALPGKEASPLFRFGMQIVMPKDFERVVYYGRGPIENYSDRKVSQDLGIYSQSVDEQFYSYIRPQENGTKSDIRWWNILNAAGQGLCITAEEPFSASSLHYTIASLDEGVAKHNSHSEEVPVADLTNVLVDKAQMGLGGVNSWGTLPQAPYMLPFGDYEFVYLLTPVRNYIDRK